MYLDTTFPPPNGRLAGLMRELNALGSTDIGAAIDAMIAALDARDGDPDLEPNGDEADASLPEGWYNPSRINPLALESEDAEQDDEAEDEDEDRCDAGDDRVMSGPVMYLHWWNPRFTPNAALVGDSDDAEHNEPPAYGADQSADLFVTAANDWPELRRA